MQITITQALAIFILSTSIARSSPSYLNFVDRLKNTRNNSKFRQGLYVLCSSILALPEFFSTAKIVDFVIVLTKL